MKSGETRFIVKKLDTKKPYTSVGFRLSNGKTTIKKSTDAEDTKDKVLVQDGVFLIPLQQADTNALQGNVTLEAQINYQDHSVIMSDDNFLYINSSLGYDPVQGSEPAEDDGIEVVMTAIEEGVAVIVNPEASQELIDAVTELFQDTKQIAQSVRDDADNGEFDGYSPQVTVKTETPSTYVLHIKDADHEFDTPNLQGQGGEGSLEAGDGLKRVGNVVSADLDDNSILEFNNHKLSADTSGLQPTIDSSHKVNADYIDDSTSTNKFTNTSEKAGWNKTTSDFGQIENIYFEESNIYNMLNPDDSVKGTIGTTGVVTENQSSAYLVSEYIEVTQGETYALTYENATYHTRYSMYPNRLCFFNTSKAFEKQATSLDDNDYFKTERVFVTGVRYTNYFKYTAKQSGYIRIQYGLNLEKPQVAQGNIYEYMDWFEPQIVLKNDVLAENNLTVELQQKINSGNALYEFNYVKLHEKVLFAGDSLTEGYQAHGDIRKDKSYPTIASKLMNCEGVNKGVSGITALSWWQSYGSQIDYSDYDGLFIYLGTNGGLTDTVEEDTASGDYHTYAETNTGGYCAVIAKALDDNPDIKIYVVKYGTTTVSNITQEIADKYGVPTILVTDTRYFTLTDSFYHTDMTHYNSVGYWALANVLMIQVEEYIKANLSDYTDLPKANMTQYQPKLTAGTNITIDSNNVISASGGGLSYTFTDGLTESSGTVGIDLASGSKLLIDSNDKLDIDLSSYATQTDLADKQDTIDSNNKLDADLVDDTNSTNKFVSANEKQTWNAKADNTTISTDTTTTTVSLTLADNHEYRYTQDLTSLTLTMPNGDFISSIVFASGSTPTSMTYDSSIKWSGDDISSNAFVPQANMEYEIVFWYNGLSVNAVVRGVA